MTPADLAHLCAEALDRRDPYIVLVVPGHARRGQRVRLAGPRSPLGTILCWCRGATPARFDALDILAWLAAHGAIKLVTPEGAP